MSLNSWLTSLKQSSRRRNRKSSERSARQKKQRSMFVEALEGRLLLTAFTDLDALDLNNSDTTIVQIGGVNAGPGSPNLNAGYDQIHVANAADIDGRLQIELINDFTPTVGDRFDILTYGSATGSFDSAAGLFGFGAGSLYFEVVSQPDRLTLVTREFAGGNGGSLLPAAGSGADAMGQFLNADYFASVSPSLMVSGTFGVGDFLEMRGTFHFEKTANQSITLTNGTTKDVAVVSVGASNVDAFAGLGPYFVDSNGDGTIDDTDSPSTDAVGVALTNLDLGLVLMIGADLSNPPDPTTEPEAAVNDSARYLSLHATADSAAIVGTGDALTAELRGLTVDINRATSPIQNPIHSPAVVDFSQLAGGGLAVATGDPDNPTVLLNSSREVVSATADDVTLALGDFVHSHGAGVALEKGPDRQVTLADGVTTKEVSVLTFGASNIDAFAGLGPYFVDSNGNGVIDDNDTPSADAVGIAIEELDLGLALMRGADLLNVPSDPQEAVDYFANYYALSAIASSATLVGMEDVVTADLRNLTIDVNLATSRTETPLLKPSVVNFSALQNGGLAVPTGDPSNPFVVLDSSSGVMLASAGRATLEVAETIFLDGSIAISKEASQLVESALGDPRQIDLLTIGGENLYGFAGVDGPYRTDTNGDGIINGVDTPNANATGLSLEGLTFGMALLKDTIGPDKYVGLKVSTDALQLVGVDGVTAVARNVDVSFNEVSPQPPVAAARLDVIDFTSFAGGKLSVETGGNSAVDLDFNERLLAASGDLTVNVSDLVTVDGVFDFQLSPSEIFAFIDGTGSVGAGPLALNVEQVTGLLIINDQGLGVDLDLSANATLLSTITVVADMNLKANTSGQNYVYQVPEKFLGRVDYTSLTITAGAPRPDGSHAPAGFYAVLDGNGTLGIADTVDVAGDVYFFVSDDELQLNTSGTMTDRAGLLPAIDVAGDLLVSSAGLVGNLQMAAGGATALFNTSAFSLSGQFQLEVNTTETAPSIQVLNVSATDGSVNGFKTGTIAANTIRVAGGMTLAVGPFNAAGAVELVFGDDGFTVALDAGVDIGFGNVHIVGGAAIIDAASGPVFAANLTMAVGVGIEQVNISGDGTLMINTSTTDAYVGVAPDTYLVNVDGTLQVLRFEMDADVTILSVGGVFRTEFSDLELDFFGFVPVTVSGFVQSDGQFLVAGTGGISMDLGPVNFSGDVSLSLSDTELSGHLHGNGGLQIGLPWPFDGVGGGATATLDGDIALGTASASVALTASFTFTVTVGIHIPWPIDETISTTFTETFSLTGSFAWSWGDPPVIARQVGDTVYLNMGADGHLRGVLYEDLTAESYTINGTGESITVQSLGQAMNFTGVKHIVATDAGAGNDYIYIGAGVSADVVLNGGADNDSLTYLGSGTAVIDGGAGNDLIRGGQGRDTLTGGAGADTVDGQDGDDALTVSGGSDTVLGGKGNDRITVQAGTNTIYGGEHDDTIIIQGGANTVYGESGRTTLQLDYSNVSTGQTTFHGDAQIDTVEITMHSDGAAALFNDGSFTFNDYTVVFDGAVETMNITDSGAATKLGSTNASGGLLGAARLSVDANAIELNRDLTAPAVRFNVVNGITLNDSLTVSGGLDDSLTVARGLNMTAGSLTTGANGSITASAMDLNLTGTASFGAPVTMTGATLTAPGGPGVADTIINVAGAMNVSANSLTANSSVDAASAAWNVAGAVVLNDRVSVPGALNIAAGSMSTHANAPLTAGDLTLNTGGAAGFDGTVSVAGAMNVTSGSLTAGKSIDAGSAAWTVAGAVALSDQLNVTGGVSVSAASFSASSNSPVAVDTMSVNTSGATSFGAAVSANGTMNVTANSLTTHDTVQLATGSWNVQAGAVLTENTVTASGALDITSRSLTADDRVSLGSGNWNIATDVWTKQTVYVAGVLQITADAVLADREITAGGLVVHAENDVELNAHPTVTGTMGSGQSGRLEIVSQLGQIDFLGQDFHVANGHLLLSAELGFTDTIRSEARALTAVNRGTGSQANITVRELDSLNILDAGLANGGVYSQNGTIDIELAAQDSLLTLASGVILTATSGQNIRLIADDFDFASGENKIEGTSTLVIRSMDDDIDYRLGSAGEDSSGTDQSISGASGTAHIGVRDFAAMGDNFTVVSIGHASIDADGVGNTMTLGDIEDDPEIKPDTPRTAKAALRNLTKFYADTVTVSGDVQAPSDRLEIHAHRARIDAKNLHAQQGLDDSGLAGQSVFLNLSEQLQHGGWIIGQDRVDIDALSSTGTRPYFSLPGELVSLKSDVGSRIATLNANSVIDIVTNESIQIAGEVEVSGVGAEAFFTTDTKLTVLEGAVVAGRDDDNVLTLDAGLLLSINPGGAVTAGARFDDVDGTPTPVQTGVGADAILNSPHELFIGGTVTTSDRMELNSGTPQFNHADYFSGLADADPDHPLIGRSQYGLLLTGTLTTLAADSELKLTSDADAIIRGNVNVLGASSDLLIQSDQFVYVEGFLDVRDDARILGGIETDRTSHNNTDPILNSSVYVATTAQIVTHDAGSLIEIQGASEVDLFGVFVSGGVIGENGVTFSGPSSAISVTAGEQVYLDTGLLASGTVTVNSGSPGADDTLAALFPGQTLGAEGDDLLSLVITTAGGITTAGITSDGSGGGITINAAGNIEMLGSVNAGANIAQHFDDDNNFLGETATYSSEPATLTITAAGRAFLGGHTLNEEGELVETGTYLRAAHAITVHGGSYSTGEGLLVHAASELTANDANGSITLTAQQDATLLGLFVAGGRIDTVRDEQGGLLGRVPVYFDGDSSVRLEAGGVIEIGQDIMAGQRIDLVGGSGGPSAGPGLTVQGSGRLLTLRENSQINLNAPGELVIQPPGHINEISAQGFTVSSFGRLTDDVTLAITVDRVDFTYSGTATLLAEDTADNASIADLVAGLQNALENGQYTITTANDPTRVGDTFTDLGDDPATAGIVDPDVKIKLRSGMLLFTSPYAISIEDTSVNATQLGVDISSGALTSTRLYAIDAAQLGSTVSIGAPDGPNGKLSLGGKVRAHSAINLYSGISPDGTDIDLGPSGVLETVNGSISFRAGQFGDIRGSIIAGGTGSDINLSAAQTLRIRGNLTADQDILLTAGSQLVAGQFSIQIDGTSHLNSTGGGGQIAVTGYNDVVFDGVFGTGSNDLALLELNAVHGNLTIPKTSGSIESDGRIALKGAVVDVQGVVHSTRTTADPSDFEIAIDASDTAIINGELQLTGSLKIEADNLVEVFSTTIAITEPGQRVVFSGGDVRFGKASTDANGDPVQLGALVTAVDRIEFGAVGTIGIGSGSVIATSGADSVISLGAGSLQIAGSPLAGALVVDDVTTFSGSGADIRVTGRELVRLGGEGIIDGETQDVGGTLIATGDITINVHGGTSDVSFTMDAGSTLRSESVTDEPAGTSHDIKIAADQDVQLYGAIVAPQTGSDITLTSGELIVVDGLLKAARRLTVIGGSDETGVGLIVNAFEFGQDSNGDSIRLHGGTLTTDAGGSIAIGADQKVVLSGIVGEVYDVAGVTFADVNDISVTKAGSVFVMTTLHAANSIRFDATDITIPPDAGIQTHATGGEIDLRASGQFMIPAALPGTQPALIQAHELVHLLGSTLSIDGQIAAASDAGRVVINAVNAVTLFGEVTSGDAIDFRAGVGANWTITQLLGAVTVADLSGGDITIDGGTLTSGGESSVLAGNDVTVVGATTVGSDLVPLRRPVIITTPQAIEVITGTRQVAVGSILVPEVTFVTTTTTEQVGTESVRVGSAFNTADITLTQLGYYNPNESPAKQFREYFVEGIDYQNSTIDWSKVYDPLSGDEKTLSQWTAPLTGTQFGALTDNQRDSVLIHLGYRKFYNAAFANLETHNTINGIPTTQVWQPDWYNATSSSSVVGAWQASGNSSDSAGEGVNGVLRGGVTYGTGQSGQGFVFDGASGTGVLVANDPTLQISNGTVDAWIKTTDTGADYHGIIVKQGAYGLYVKGGKLVAFDGAIVLAAGNLGGDVMLTDSAIDADGTSGDISLSAPGGTVQQTGGIATGRRFTVRTADGVTVNADVSEFDVRNTVAGDVTLLNLSDVNFVDVLTNAGGPIDVLVFGDITMGSVDTSHDVSLRATGQFSQHANTTINGRLLTLAASEIASALNTSLSFLTLTSAGTGNVVVHNSGTQSLELDVTVTDGSLTVDTAGDLLVRRAVSLTDSDSHDITLSSGGDIQIDLVQAGAFAETEADARRIRLSQLSGALRASGFLLQNAADLDESLFLALDVTAARVSLVTWLTADIFAGQADVDAKAEAEADRQLSLTQPIHADGDVTLNAAGAIREWQPEDAAVDVIADSLTITSGLGVTGLETSLNRIASVLNVSELVEFGDVDSIGEIAPGLNVEFISNANGSVRISVDEDLEVEQVRGLSATGDVTLTSGKVLRLLPVSDVSDTVVAGHDLTLYSVDNLFISGGISAPNAVSVSSAADVKLSGTTLNLSTAEAILIESDSSLSITGTLESAKGISLISNHGDVEVIGIIQGRNGAPLESLMIIARGNLMKSGPFAGQYRFRSLIDDATYYANTPELVSDSLVLDAANQAVQNFAALDLVPFTTTNATVMKDPVTGLDFFRDPTTGATPNAQQRYLRYIGASGEEFYRRTDPTTGYYPFSAIRNETTLVTGGVFDGRFQFQSLADGDTFGRTYYADAAELSSASVVVDSANHAVADFASLSLVPFVTQAAGFIELLYSTTEDPTMGTLYACDGTEIDPATISNLETTLVAVTDPVIITRLLPFTLKEANDGRATGTSISLQNAEIGTVSRSVIFIAQGPVLTPVFTLDGPGSSITVIVGEDLETGAWRAENISAQSTGIFDATGSFIGGDIVVSQSFRTASQGDPETVSLTALNDITLNASVTPRQSLQLHAGGSLFNLPDSISVNGVDSSIDLAASADLQFAGSLSANGLISLVSTGSRGPGGAIVVGGNVTSGSGPILLTTASDSSRIGGVISGSGGLTLSGGGTLTLDGASTYSGTTQVISSRLVVSGSTEAGSDVVLSDGSTLGGTGRVGGSVRIQDGSTLSPGTSPGLLQTGDLSLEADSTFVVEIGGLLAGAEYDQVSVTGSVSLGGAELTLTPVFDPFPLHKDDQFVLIRNDGSDSVIGRLSYAGELLEEGMVVRNFLGTGRGATITYVGNADGGSVGNDVILTIIMAV